MSIPQPEKSADFSRQICFSCLKVLKSGLFLFEQPALLFGFGYLVFGVKIDSESIDVLDLISSVKTEFYPANQGESVCTNIVERVNTQIDLARHYGKASKMKRYPIESDNLR